MVRLVSSTSLLAVVICFPASIHAQSTALDEFDVVSIKRNTSTAGGGMRTLPDGTLVMTNQPIRSIIMSASPVPAREVVGLPDWAMTERYDVTARPPAESTREQRGQMWRTLFAQRMKLVGRVEQHERDTFALVLARADGRLGPQIERSTLDCSARSPGSAPPPSQTPPALADMRNRCGGALSATSIVSGGMTMAQFVQSLGGLAGRLVNDHTGLEGAYAFTLSFSRPRAPGASPISPDRASVDDAPEIFTALQEQLGLKLQPDKTMVPVFVIDHIERPSEN
jgi:uncharacterized protein (TIGR03435 family)